MTGPDPQRPGAVRLSHEVPELVVNERGTPLNAHWYPNARVIVLRWDTQVLTLTTAEVQALHDWITTNKLR